MFVAKLDTVLIPVSRVLRDYWHLEPYLLENKLSLKALTELSFDITDMHLSFDVVPSFGWSVMNLMEEFFMVNVAHNADPATLSDEQVMTMHNLMVLTHEIHTLVQAQVRQYASPPSHGYHTIRKWVGDNILIETYR